ncbi:hypothetical protein H4219_002698 [Mycoemilia scoparia]|uniref:Pre-mRNA processing factor 4 (PRP4)-like domain-containing protein n=1 Tax=Mycoemilia scoparia TaxID=417184 RepID=A0A9W7ZWY5_9FUNG|nr:hypothetical protein H4219_002698 [Mycoemilia scoparia]
MTSAMNPGSNGGNAGSSTRIHFGSLEQQAVENAKRKRKEEQEEQSSGAKGGVTLDELDATNLDDANIYEMGEGSSVSMGSHQAVLEELERKRLARTLAVPTADVDVRAKLRECGEPICLFGEDAADRRNRLRNILSVRQLRASKEKDQMEVSKTSESEESEEDEDEEFYTEGSVELLESRKQITKFSLMRAKNRIAQQQSLSKAPLEALKTQRQNLYKSLKNYTIFGSQVCDSRPVSKVAFSPDSKMIATGSWSGLVKLWKTPQCENIKTLRGHTDRVGGLAFHPKATIGLDTSAANLASGGADNNIHLWSLESDIPISTLEGHAARVSNIDFHPTGEYLGSASFDGSWRLWDVATGKELLLQEGHAKEVFTIKFQCDGSLAASGGLDAIGSVWDIRSGRRVMVLEGHTKEIYGIDWSPNGYQLVTGGADNAIKVFDIRARKTIYTIPAHNSLISDVKFFHGQPQNLSNGQDAMHIEGANTGLSYPSGQYLASSSYDGMVKIWAADTWKLIKALPGHDGKIMSLDISLDGQFISSTGFDRTFKLWANEDLDIDL